MSDAGTFWLSFLDGFTMAGFFGGLRIPGDSETLFAAAQSESSPLELSAIADEGERNRTLELVVRLGVESIRGEDLEKLLRFLGEISTKQRKGESELIKHMSAETGMGFVREVSVKQGSKIRL